MRTRSGSIFRHLTHLSGVDSRFQNASLVRIPDAVQASASIDVDRRWKVLRIDVPEAGGLMGRVHGQQPEPRAGITMPGADIEPSRGIVEPSMQGRVARPARWMYPKRTVVIFKMSEDVAAPARVARIGEATDRATRRMQPRTGDSSSLLVT